MTLNEFKNKSKKGALRLIREQLAFPNEILGQLRYIDKETFKKEHRRFEMGGYEENVLSNMAMVNEFAELGIYNHVNYLSLRFYKGQPIIYYQLTDRDANEKVELDGYTTSEIIYEILKITVL